MSADRRRRDMHLFACLDEAAVAASRLEGAQSIERGELHASIRLSFPEPSTAHCSLKQVASGRIEITDAGMSVGARGERRPMSGTQTVSFGSVPALSPNPI